VIDVPIAFAFSAGLLATVNPCGFVMLPAYLSFFLGHEQSRPDAPRRRSVHRALIVSAVMAAGFLLVFAITGLLVNAGVRFFLRYLPWAGIVIGAGLVALGIGMLAGYRPRVSLPRPERSRRDNTPTAWFVFGVSYAIASLSCTLPIFLTVVAGTVIRTNFLSGVAAFLAYGLGMTTVVVTLTLALALAKDSLVGVLKSGMRHVERAAGILLIITGGYLVYYWTFNLSTTPGTRAGAGPARFVENLSFDIANWLDHNWLRLIIVVAGLVLAVATYRTLTRNVERTPQPPTSEHEATADADREAARER